MSLKEYYHQTFRPDLALVLDGVPLPEARIVCLGHDWVQGCSLLRKVPPHQRPHFLACLYFTILVDQAVHTYFLFEHRRFEELTQYPKFRLGLGHPAYLNPVLVFEAPIRNHLISEAGIREIIPDAMRLFVEETASFFRDHMPQIRASDLLASLLADPDVSGGRAFGADSAATEQVSLQELLARELSKAVSGSGHQRV